MADIAITAANVVAGAGATIANGKAAATITAGQVVYLDATTGLYSPALNNSGTPAVRSPAGIALNSASAGQPVQVIQSGPVTIGGTLVAGVAYYLSATAGGICPVADLGVGKYPVVLGIATSTAVLKVGMLEAGVSL